MYLEKQIKSIREFKVKFSRIMIFGRPGSGKSTFALKLHKLTNLPLHHLDKHFFLANWVARDYGEFLGIQRDIVEQDEWIIDGNSLKSLEMRYSRANLVLYFNFPRWKCYLRVVKRLFVKDKEIKDRAEGCKENIRPGLLHFMWIFEKRYKDEIQRLREKYPEVRFIEINSNEALISLERKLL
jgi:adenylate kinase family enzyme